jgi:hypothetical protein
MILLDLLFAGAAAVGSAAFATATAEDAAEASAYGDAGAVGVAAAGDRSIAATSDYAAEAVASPAAVVVAVGEDDGNKTAVAVGALRLGGLLSGKVSAEFVVDDFVVFVDAALHLGLAASGEEGERGCCEDWGGNLG